MKSFYKIDYFLSVSVGLFYFFFCQPNRNSIEFPCSIPAIFKIRPMFLSLLFAIILKGAASINYGFIKGAAYLTLQL